MDTGPACLELAIFLIFLWNCPTTQTIFGRCVRGRTTGAQSAGIGVRLLHRGDDFGGREQLAEQLGGQGMAMNQSNAT